MILFLDYDGVLHPDDAYLVNGRPVLQTEGTLFMWAPILMDLLQPYPDLKIVLSTSWVQVLGFTRARDFLPSNLRSRVIGGTWHSAMGRHSEGSHRLHSNWFVQASRYEQIARYVSRAGAQVVHWIALDDDTDGWDENLLSRLVVANGDLGLSSINTQSDLRAKLQLLYSQTD